MYKKYQGNNLLFTNHTIAKSMPLVTVPTFKSQLFKNSILYKGAKIWNSLPNCWILNELGLNKFKELTIEWIIAKRSDADLY